MLLPQIVAYKKFRSVFVMHSKFSALIHFELLENVWIFSIFLLKKLNSHIQFQEKDKLDMKNIVNGLITVEKHEMAQDKDTLNVILNHKRFFMRALLTLILT